MDTAPRTTPARIRVLGKLRAIISKSLRRPQPGKDKRKRTKELETNYDRVPVYSAIHTNYILYGMERHCTQKCLLRRTQVIRQMRIQIREGETRMPRRHDWDHTTD